MLATFMLCTGTSTTPWSYWRRVTSPYHGAPGATSRSPGRRSMGATWRQTNAEREQKEKSGDSRLRREMQQRRGRSTPTGRGCISLRSRESPDFSFCSRSALVCLQVAPIERLPGDLKVAPGAPW